MFSFFLKKLTYSALVILGVLTVVFLLFNVLPGDPARMMLDQQENSEQLELVRKKYGFDLPVWQQYLYYLNDVSPVAWHQNVAPEKLNYEAEGKYTILVKSYTDGKGIAIKAPYLRESFQKSGKKVSGIIADTFPNTAVLAVAAITFAFVVGIFLGLVSALFKDQWIDRVLGVVSVLGMSLPSFFSAILIAWIFGYLLSDYTGLNMTGSWKSIDDYGEFVSIEWRNLILPAFTLGIRPLAVIIQLTRSSMLEVLHQDYVRTAISKGLSRHKMLFKHALQNTLNPVITATSGWFASMLAGAVFVEYIFGWNGMGKQVVEALNQLDLPVVTGMVIVIAVIFVVINLSVDAIYGWVDPRIRISKSK